jgi:hypothetical protein
MSRDKMTRDTNINRAWMLRGRDEVAPEHHGIHAELQRWGLWATEKYQQGHCASLEHRFDSRGGRIPSRAIVALPPDPKLRQLESAILWLQEPHRETIEQYYAKRWAPKTICWSHAIQYEDFARWMYDCRQGVINAMVVTS